MMVAPGEKYQHYKGNTYEIVGIGRHTETDEELVVYRALSGDHVGQLWFRPVNMFDEYVLQENQQVPRFRRLIE